MCCHSNTPPQHVEILPPEQVALPAPTSQTPIVQTLPHHTHLDWHLPESTQQSPHSPPTQPEPFLWDPQSNPGGFVNLGVAENSLMHEELIEYLNSSFNITSRSLNYGDGATGSRRLRHAIARFVNRHFDPSIPVGFDQVAVVNGVTAGLEACAWALGVEGDSFLLGRPYYASFPRDIAHRAGVKTIEVSFGHTDPFSLEAISMYEQALIQSPVRPRALLLCSPHNPLGRCYSKTTLIELMRLCQKYHMHLVVDEIYALSTWTNFETPDAPPFTSVLSIDPTGIIDPELIHVLWGMSKDFGTNGLRLGCLISRNEPLVDAVRTKGLFTYPSCLADHVTANILSDDTFVDAYISTNQARLAASYQFVAETLQSLKIPYQQGCNAGFFLWIDLRRNSNLCMDESAHIDRVLRKHRLFLGNGERYRGEESGWFRLIFSHPIEYLDEGLKRLVVALQELDGGIQA